MKIKGTRDQFLNCLSKVSPATDRANINPILSNVLLIADTVDIIATDQENANQIAVRSQGEQKI